MAAALGAEPATDVGCVPVATADSRARGRRGLDEAKSEAPRGEMEALRKMVAEVVEAGEREAALRAELRAEADERVAALLAELRASHARRWFESVRARVSPVPSVHEVPDACPLTQLPQRPFRV